MTIEMDGMTAEMFLQMCDPTMGLSCQDLEERQKEILVNIKKAYPARAAKFPFLYPKDIHDA